MFCPRHTSRWLTALALALALPLVAGTLEGYVKDPQSGAALAGLHLQLNRGPAPDAAGEDAWDWVAGTQSDANGHYSFTELEARRYRVHASAGKAGNNLRYTEADLFNVAVGATGTTTAPDLQPRQAGYLYGYVRDAGGSPIEEARVLVNARYTSDGSDWHWVRTDASGYYELLLAPTSAALYPVQILDAPNPAGGWYAVQIAPGLYAASTNGTRGPDFSLSPGGALHGRLLAGDGTPVPNVYVGDPMAAIANGFFESGDIHSDGNGEFVLASVPPDTDVWLELDGWSTVSSNNVTYARGAHFAGPYRVSAGQTLEIGSLFYLPAGTVQVTVTYGGNPVADAGVTLRGFTLTGSGFDMEEDSVPTSAQGQCTLTGIPPGRYTLNVAADGCLPYHSAQAITVTAGQTTTASVALTASGGACTVTGSIWGYGSLAPRNAAGTLLPFIMSDNYDAYGYSEGMGVFAYPPAHTWTDAELLWPDDVFTGGGEVSDGYGDYFAFSTGTEGTFAGEIPAGNNTLAGYLNVATSVAGGDSGLLSDPLSITNAPAGDTLSGQVVTFPYGTASVSGTITFPGSYTPVWAEGRVQVFLVPTGSSGSLGRAVAAPGPSGQYAMTRLPAGNYYVKAVALGMNPYTSADFALSEGQAVTRNVTFTSAAGNRAPIIDAASPSAAPASMAEGDPFVLGISAHDLDATDMLRFAWWYRIGTGSSWLPLPWLGNEQATTPGLRGLLPKTVVTHPNTTATDYQIRAVVMDCYGSTAETVWAIGTVHDVNQLPSQAGQAAALSGGATRTEPVVCTLSQAATDADAEDTITYTYAWSNGQQTVTHTGAALTDTLATAELARGQTWSCTVTARDQLGGTATDSVTSGTVTVGNSVPAVVNQNRNVQKGELLDVAAPGVLTGATDADGDALTAMLVNGPAHGNLVFQADGRFTYTPDTDYAGADSFVFNATDGWDESATATVNLAVTDTVPPAVQTLVPANGATGVDTTATLAITFTETVAKGSSGSVTIYQLNGTAFQTIPIGDDRVAVSGATVTIHAGAAFAAGQSYYVTVDASCIKDLAGNAFAGIAGSATWVFATLPPLDEDGDQLDDNWEMARFNTLKYDGTEDLDGDGLTNAQEYATGGDPLGYEFILEQGWNLVSIARPPANRSPQAVFANAAGVSVINAAVWAWDAARRCYVMATAIEPCRGYWVYAPQRATVVVQFH